MAVVAAVVAVVVVKDDPFLLHVQEEGNHNGALGVDAADDADGGQAAFHSPAVAVEVVAGLAVGHYRTMVVGRYHRNAEVVHHHSSKLVEVHSHRIQLEGGQAEDCHSLEEHPQVEDCHSWEEHQKVQEEDSEEFH